MPLHRGIHRKLLQSCGEKIQYIGKVVKCMQTQKQVKSTTFSRFLSMQPLKRN